MSPTFKLLKLVVRISLLRLNSGLGTSRVLLCILLQTDVFLYWLLFSTLSHGGVQVYSDSTACAISCATQMGLIKLPLCAGRPPMGHLI